MHLFDALKLAMQNLSRTKFRTFLTMLGVIIGISAIVLFVSLGLGLQEITSNQIASIDALTTLTVTQTPETASMQAGPILTEASVKEFKSLKNVVKASESVSLTVTVKYGDTTAGSIVYGIKPENASMEVSSLKFGQLPKGESEAVITTALANSFDTNNNNLIGKTIAIKMIQDDGGIQYSLPDIELNVVGIDSNSTTNMVYAPLNQIYTAGKFDKFSAVKIKVKNRDDVGETKKSVEQLGYQVTTIKDLIDQIDKIFLLFQIILAFVGGIGLLVSSLGIINTMTISLLERTREIGIMKAIGASNRDIKRLFLIESGLLGLFGGIIGIAVAVGLGNLCNFILNYFAKQSSQPLRLFITPIKFSVCVAVFSILVALFSGIYPAHRAKKLLPMDALRQ